MQRSARLLPAMRLLSHSSPAALPLPRARVLHRPLSSDADQKSIERAETSKGAEVSKKVWGSALELKEVSKEEAEEKFLDVTDLKRTLMPPTAVAVSARDDMLNDRFNYVSTHLSGENAYIVAGKQGSIAPAAVGQSGMALASLCVVMGAITAVVYIKTQWGVTSAKDLGDKLREKGAARREALESSGTVGLVRSISANAETAVKDNVDIVRRPSQQMGEHFEKSFKGVVKKKEAD
ncbi:MAG: hypothetical protein SGPRY_007739 [Prymnesium sp.]